MKVTWQGSHWPGQVSRGQVRQGPSITACTGLAAGMIPGHAAVTYPCPPAGLFAGHPGRSFFQRAAT